MQENARFICNTVELIEQVEAKAVATGDYDNAGWRARDVCHIHYIRGKGDAVLVAADRTMNQWQTAKTGNWERAIATRSRASALQKSQRTARMAVLVSQAKRIFSPGSGMITSHSGRAKLRVLAIQSRAGVSPWTSRIFRGLSLRAYSTSSWRGA